MHTVHFEDRGQLEYAQFYYLNHVLLIFPRIEDEPLAPLCGYIFFAIHVTLNDGLQH